MDPPERNRELGPKCLRAKEVENKGGEMELQPPTSPLTLHPFALLVFFSSKKHGQGSASTRGPSASSGSRKIQGAKKIAQTIASESRNVSQIGAPKNAIV